ncbi:hypothetical protein LBMAG18_09850 [Alphaproteobacteria bacterium]|nr:hypothetical protein LBMAG18_09850 [Alphaproteobacteria bacterium]
MLNQNTLELFSLLNKCVFTNEEKDDIFERIKYLLNQNINIKGKNTLGQNVLHLAASKSDSRVVEALIEAGADVNSKDNYLETPINLAIFAGQTEIIEILIKKNARLDQININGNNALHIALTYEDPKIADFLAVNFLFGENISIGTHIENFEEYINCQNIEGKTPLHIASEFNKGEAVRLLLMLGANSQLKTFNGEKPLHLAARKFSTDALIALNQEFIKENNISCIEDYKIALGIIIERFPNPSIQEKNNFRKSLAILKSVVDEYEEQEKVKKDLLQGSIQFSGKEEGLQSENDHPSAKEFTVVEDEGCGSDSQPKSPSTCLFLLEESKLLKNTTQENYPLN